MSRVGKGAGCHTPLDPPAVNLNWKSLARVQAECMRVRNLRRPDHPTPFPELISFLLHQTTDLFLRCNFTPNARWKVRCFTPPLPSFLSKSGSLGPFAEEVCLSPLEVDQILKSRNYEYWFYFLNFKKNLKMWHLSNMCVLILIRHRYWSNSSFSLSGVDGEQRVIKMPR